MVLPSWDVIVISMAKSSARVEPLAVDAVDFAFKPIKVALFTPQFYTTPQEPPAALLFLKAREVSSYYQPSLRFKQELSLLF